MLKKPLKYQKILSSFMTVYSLFVHVFVHKFLSIYLLGTLLHMERSKINDVKDFTFQQRM